MARRGVGSLLDDIMARRGVGSLLDDIVRRVFARLAPQNRTMQQRFRPSGPSKACDGAAHRLWQRFSQRFSELLR